MTRKERVVGRFKGTSEGPLVVILGAMHGNEPAGIIALEEFFNSLNQEVLNDEDFDFKGDIVGLMGNVRAFEINKRFIKQDLNRIWTPDNIFRIKNSDKINLHFEEKEMKELMDCLHHIIEGGNYSTMYVLDIHSTSSDSAVFSISSYDRLSLQLACALQVPVITGLTKDLGGTSLHFFHSAQQPLPTVALGLECGHHTDPASAQRSLQAIYLILDTLGIYQRRDRTNTLTPVMKGVFEVIYRHHVDNIREWSMLPGFTNFQPVHRGEHLAYFNREKVLCPSDGYILMPLYQSQGQDGFFIIRKINDC